MQKPATQVNYDSVWCDHIGPHPSEMPLSVIDEDQLSLFRATLRQRLRATTANQVLATQTYLHTQQVGLAREATELLDRAATRSRGKTGKDPQLVL